VSEEREYEKIDKMLDSIDRFGKGIKDRLEKGDEYLTTLAGDPVSKDGNLREKMSVAFGGKCRAIALCIGVIWSNFRVLTLLSGSVLDMEESAAEREALLCNMETTLHAVGFKGLTEEEIKSVKRHISELESSMFGETTAPEPDTKLEKETEDVAMEEGKE